MYILCMVILGFFALIGLCSFIAGITQNDVPCAKLILSGLSADNAEAQLRAAAGICRRHKNIRLICICGRNDPAYDICRLMQKDHPFIEIEPK